MMDKYKVSILQLTKIIGTMQLDNEDMVVESCTGATNLFVLSRVGKISIGFDFYGKLCSASVIGLGDFGYKASQSQVNLHSRALVPRAQTPKACSDDLGKSESWSLNSGDPRHTSKDPKLRIKPSGYPSH